MNRRVVFAGVLLIVLAAGFFLLMMSIAPRSNDPKVMMETVGQVSGAAGGLGLVMILFGMLKRRRP